MCDRNFEKKKAKEECEVAFVFRSFTSFVLSLFTRASPRSLFIFFSFHFFFPYYHYKRFLINKRLNKNCRNIILNLKVRNVTF